MDIFGLVFGGLVVGFIIITLISSIVFTDENHYSFITMFGKYNTTLPAGLAFKIPFVTAVDKTAFLGLASEEVQLKLKTKDQVTFNLKLNVQYQISHNKEEAYKAMYNISNYLDEMSNVATNASISIANSIMIEDVYDKKEQILDTVKQELTEFFDDYGITITRVLSDEPRLPKELEDQANEVMKAKRKKEASTFNADAIRIEKVGAAEADGESVKIRMENLGQARKDFADKTAEAVEALMATGCSSSDALNFLHGVAEQDAIVTASRNGATMIFRSGDSNNISSSDALLADMLKKEKTELPVATTSDEVTEQED